MERKRYDKARHSVRRILHYFSEEDTFERKIEYRFGLVMNPELECFYLYDSIPDKVIASIKPDKEVVVRYDDISEWKYEIMKFKMDERKPIIIPSTNLGRHIDLVHRRVGNRCNSEVDNFNRFLEAPEGIETSSRWEQTYTWPLMTSVLSDIPLEAFGRSTEVPYRELRVVFHNQDRYNEELATANSMVNDFQSRGLELSSTTLTYNQLTELYTRLQEQLHGRTRNDVERAALEYYRGRTTNIAQQVAEAASYEWSTSTTGDTLGYMDMVGLLNNGVSRESSVFETEEVPDDL